MDYPFMKSRFDLIKDTEFAESLEADLKREAEEEEARQREYEQWAAQRFNEMQEAEEAQIDLEAMQDLSFDLSDQTGSAYDD